MDKPTPLVSIIMPVYNSKKYVKESINSVVSQTYSQWELIIIDDCSKDNTYEFLFAEYSDNKKIKILQNNYNSGAGVTRNKGLENAQGSLIAFLDADDLWLPEKLSKQVTFMNERSCAIVHTSYCFINELGIKIPGRVDVSEVVTLRSYMRNTEIGMSTSLLDKRVVGDFRLGAMRTRQDTFLWLTLLSNGHVATGLNEQLVEYRIRGGQISGNKLVIAYRTLKLYLSIKNVPLIERLVNYCFYAYNAAFKRLIK